MNYLPLFLAQRMLFTSPDKKYISTIASISFAGIFIGTFSLIIVTAIMRGFEVVIHNKIQGIHSHITIDAYGKPLNFKALSTVLRNEFPEIAAFSPHAERNALIRAHAKEMPNVIVIKSINPTYEIDTSSLADKIIEPCTNDFAHLFADNSIVIGKQYARSNNLAVGDTVELLFTSDEKIKTNSVTFESQIATISGIFDTGIDEFDSNVVYCSFTFLKNIFPDVATEQVAIKLHDQNNESATIKKLHNRLNLSVYSWKDLYPSLVATLTLEKYVSFSVILLILLVASMNIVSLIHMQITQKRHDIAILKALGMHAHAIKNIFFIAGLVLSFSASLLGALTAIITGYYIKKYPFISLPDTYYATHLPMALEIYMVINVLVLVFLLTLLTLYLSTRQINSLAISHVLRGEK